MKVIFAVKISLANDEFSESVHLYLAMPDVYNHLVDVCRLQQRGLLSRTAGYGPSLNSTEAVFLVASS